MDWKQLLVGEETFSFLLEVVFRTLVMFLFLVFTLRLSGKRGVKQLSIFEMVMIIGLGSAAGDPMFYKSVGILPAILVFILILSFYRTMVFIITRSEKLERFFEGEAKYIIKNGVSTASSINKEELAPDEFFAELRSLNIDHFGQIKCAVLETSGEISVLYFKDEEVLPGLPIWPELYKMKQKKIMVSDTYACSHCGHVEIIQAIERKVCSKCKNDEWVKALSCKRIK